MWSLPQTESKPSSSHRSAVGRTSEGFAKGTGYIMPSMHVGMWTPNFMRGAPEGSAAGGEPRRELGGDLPELLRRVGVADGQGDGDVEAGLHPRGEPAARVIGGAGEREGVDLLLGDEGGARLAAGPRRPDGERLGLGDAGLAEDRLAVEVGEVPGEDRPHGPAGGGAVAADRDGHVGEDG